jgi:putative transcriptional regulator
MIVNRVSRLLGDRRESVADLSRSAGIAYTSAYELYRGKVKRIDFVTLDRLCKHFGVTPCEILEYVPEAQAEAAEAVRR